MKPSLQILFSFLFVLLMAKVNKTMAQDFYPLEAHNKWDYRLFYNNYPNPMDSSTTQIEVLGDTILPNGYHYTRLSRPDILGSSFIRYDSNYIYYCSPYSGKDVAMYNLRDSVGTIDTITGWGPLGRAQVRSVVVQELFGAQREVRSYSVDGLVQYQVTLARGLGIVDAYDFGDGAWPFSVWWNIRGCTIRDTLYGTKVNVDDRNELPTNFKLYQNYPNPFNPSTTIKFDIFTSCYVRLFVSNLLGEEIVELINKPLAKGSYQILFDGHRFSSGVYFYTLSSPLGILN